MTESIQLRLSRDEALVLYALLARWEDEGVLSASEPAEERVLDVLGGQLDKILVEPFREDYKAVVQAARERLADGR